MKKLIPILIVEFLLAYFIFSIGFFDRLEHQRAFIAWHKNPTSQTRAELDRQGRITGLYNLGLSGVAFGVMAAGTVLITRPWRR